MGFTDLTAFLRMECQEVKLNSEFVTRNIGSSLKESDLTGNLGP
jgi:hypothetical protein